MTSTSLQMSFSKGQGSLFVLVADSWYLPFQAAAEFDFCCWIIFRYEKQRLSLQMSSL